MNWLHKTLAGLLGLSKSENGLNGLSRRLTCEGLEPRLPLSVAALTGAAFVGNGSVSTLCAEEDNVNIPLTIPEGNGSPYRIVRHRSPPSDL